MASYLGLYMNWVGTFFLAMGRVHIFFDGVFSWEVGVYILWGVECTFLEEGWTSSKGCTCFQEEWGIFWGGIHISRGVWTGHCCFSNEQPFNFAQVWYILSNA